MFLVFEESASMQNITKKTIFQIGNGIAFVSVVVVNFLANLLPINNLTTGELSDNYPNLFVPAGLTFSIWGVIYLLLLVFVIYQAQDLFSKKKKELAFLYKIHLLFIGSCVINILWVFFWHYEYVILSLMTIVVLFIVLLMIYLRLDIGKASVNVKERLAVHVPFSVYLGWITVATIANVTAALVCSGWTGGPLSEEIWTILVIVVGLLITGGVLFTRRDIAYGLVIVWAYLGIVIKQQDPFLGNTTVSNTALISLIIIAIACVVVFLWELKEKGMVIQEKQTRQ